MWCPCDMLCFRNTFLVLTHQFLRHYRHQIHDSSVLTWIFYWLSAQHLLTCLTCNIPLLLQTVCHCTSASGASQCPPPLPLLPLLVFHTNKHHHSKLGGTQNKYNSESQFLTLPTVKKLFSPHIQDSRTDLMGRWLNVTDLWSQKKGCK